VHRQSKVGVVVHADAGKFAERNEAKHDRAHIGMNSVMSAPKVYMGEEEVWAVTSVVVARKYIKARKLAGKTPILRVLMLVS
jgi:hypothetical protein